VVVPLTVAPAAGAENVTVGFDGLVLPLETVTVRVAEPVRPAESRTVAVSVIDPLGTVVVFHEKLGPVPLSVVVPARSV
jgi:hypothetical protein